MREEAKGGNLSKDSVLKERGVRQMEEKRIEMPKKSKKKKKGEGERWGVKQRQ